MNKKKEKNALMPKKMFKNDLKYIYKKNMTEKNN